MVAAGACSTVLVVEQAASDRHSTNAVAISLMRIPGLETAGSIQSRGEGIATRLWPEPRAHVDGPSAAAAASCAASGRRHGAISGHRPGHARALDGIAARVLPSPP